MAAYLFYATKPFFATGGKKVRRDLLVINRFWRGRPAGQARLRSLRIPFSLKGIRKILGLWRAASQPAGRLEPNLNQILKHPGLGGLPFFWPPNISDTGRRISQI